MEKRKKRREWVVFDLWPFISSLLPTFIPLNPLLLISHSPSNTCVPLLSRFPVLHPLYSSTLSFTVRLSGPACLDKNDPSQFLGWVSMHLRASKLWSQQNLHGNEWLCHLAGLFWHKQEHTQTNKVNERMHELLWVCGQFCLGNYLYTGTKRLSFSLNYGPLDKSRSVFFCSTLCRKA